MLELVDDGRFQVGFGIGGFLIESEKLQDVGFFQEIVRSADDLAVLRQLSDSALVPAQRQAFIEAGVELALQFANRPAVFYCLDFVEGAFFRIANSHEQHIVRPP